RQHAVPSLVRKVEEGSVVVDAGAVDENIDSPPALPRRRHGLVDRGRVRYVSRARPSAATASDDVGRNRFYLRRGPGDEQNVRSLGGEPACGRLADPAAAARQNDGPSGKAIGCHSTSAGAQTFVRL